MSMLKWLNRAVLLASVFALCSCAGRLTWENVDALKGNPNTTKAEVVRELGQPDSTLARADGVEVYTYSLLAPYAAGTKFCNFIFKNGKLINYTESASGIYRR